MKRYLDYETLMREAIDHNIEDLRENLMDASVLEKINNWAEKYCLEPEFVRQKVCEDDIFALCFVKDPGRQSFHEKAASRFIEQSPLVCDFVGLPKAGKKAKYIHHGLVVSGKDKNSLAKTSKSIDFEWKYVAESGDAITFYATHKYTKNEGGGQDNQYNDVVEFMEASSSCSDNNVFFFAICDGPYYNKSAGGSSVTRRVNLNRQKFRGDRNMAVEINGLDAKIALVVKQWAEKTSVSLTTEEIERLDRIIEGYAKEG